MKQLEQLCDPSKTNVEALLVCGIDQSSSLSSSISSSISSSSFQLNKKLFETLSSCSEIDHPLCEECANVVVMQLEIRITEATREQQQLEFGSNMEINVDDDVVVLGDNELVLSIIINFNANLAFSFLIISYQCLPCKARECHGKGGCVRRRTPKADRRGGRNDADDDDDSGDNI